MKTFSMAGLAALGVGLWGCATITEGTSQDISAVANPTISAEFRPISPGRHVVPLELRGGTYRVPTLINGVMTLTFTVDSGSADVTIPSDVFSALLRDGTIAKGDLLDERTYRLADGRKEKSQTFRIRSLKVGDVVMENVLGSVTDVKGMLLLGQSFLGKLNSWSMDNSARALIID